jgi:hypothetical protein
MGAPASLLAAAIPEIRKILETTTGPYADLARRVIGPGS